MITVAFAPDGATMATGSQDGVLRMWNRPTSVIDAHTDRVMTPRFSSDGSHMATALSTAPFKCGTPLIPITRSHGDES